MFRRRIIFITLYKDNNRLYDYPKELPIPKIGETVIFEDISGQVYDVRHITTGKTSEIKICVK